MKPSWLVMLFLLPSIAAADMLAGLNLKQNDTLPPYDGQVLLSDRITPYDLTGTTITATMTPVSVFWLPTPVAVFTGAACNVTNSKQGLFEYDWQASDTVNTGHFRLLFTIQVGTKQYTIPATDLADVYINSR